MFHYLFGFSGRINRAKMWAFVLIIIGFYIVSACIIAAALGTQAIVDAAESHTVPKLIMGSPVIRPILGLLGLVVLALIFTGFAIATKRLHDRNKSAWWLLVFYALPFVLNLPRQIATWNMLHGPALANAIAHGTPLPPASPLATIASGVATLISLWAFVELYCLRGTTGDNRYGSDPLAR